MVGEFGERGSRIGKGGERGMARGSGKGAVVVAGGETGSVVDGRKRTGWKGMVLEVGLELESHSLVAVVAADKVVEVAVGNPLQLVAAAAVVVVAEERNYRYDKLSLVFY